MSPGIDVLVVDDEPVVRDAIRLVLAHEGLSVASVPDAESALEHPALGDCRLVICDLMLPGRSGLETLRAMRERRPRLPIVMITGYATPANADLVLEAGATAFLPKPFDESELLTLVRHVLTPMDAAGEERNP
jgi:two-component system C4-dicarboxylate transport response regulator DctD